MKRALAVALGLLLTVTASLAAHDLFVKPASFFLAPNAPSQAYVVNGTFTRSCASRRSSMDNRPPISTSLQGDAPRVERA